MSLFRIAIKRSLGLLSTFVVFAAAALAPAANAAVLAPTATCATPGATSKPFQPWTDFANYFVAPGGGAEGQLVGWKLTGGSGPSAGNETYYVHSLIDRQSLLIPAGGSATTAAACITADSPNFRFFTRNGGTKQGTLKVQVNGVGLLGETRSLWSTSFNPAAAWKLSSSINLVVNLNALLSTNGTTPMSITFSATGGPVLVDDVYVDPYRRG